MSGRQTVILECDGVECQERGLAIGALRSLWDAIPKDVELPLTVAAQVLFLLEHDRRIGDE